MWLWLSLGFGIVVFGLVLDVCGLVDIAACGRYIHCVPTPLRRRVHSLHISGGQPAAGCQCSGIAIQVA